MSTLTVVQEQKCFGGRQIRYQHAALPLWWKSSHRYRLDPIANTTQARFGLPLAAAKTPKTSSHNSAQ
jgi:hypothetical protein